MVAINSNSAPVLTSAPYHDKAEVSRRSHPSSIFQSDSTSWSQRAQEFFSSISSPNFWHHPYFTHLTKSFPTVSFTQDQLMMAVGMVLAGSVALTRGFRLPALVMSLLVLAGCRDTSEDSSGLSPQATPPLPPPPHLPASTVPPNCLEAPPSAFVNDAGTVAVDVLTLGIGRLFGFEGFGYTELNRNGHLFGRVEAKNKQPMVTAPDGDWNVYVKPVEVPTNLRLDGFRSNVALTDRAADVANGSVECELCNKCASLVGFRLPREHDFVQEDGIHVFDNAHGGKTEIHPVTGQRLVAGQGIRIGLLEGGSSKPNRYEEVFRLAISSGGTCPDYSFARVSTINGTKASGQVILHWPHPPSSRDGVHYVPAFSVQGLENYNGDRLVRMIDFQPVVGNLRMSFGDINKDNRQQHLHAVGNHTGAWMHVNLENDSGILETTHAYYDIRLFWVPLSVHIELDALTDLGLQTSGGQAHRAWEMAAHVEMNADNPQVSELFNPHDMIWYLHPTDTGYEVPPKIEVGRGLRMSHVHRVGTDPSLAFYNTRLELFSPNFGSLYLPVGIPRPYARVIPESKTTICLGEGTSNVRRQVEVKLRSSTVGFANGPNLNWEAQHWDTRQTITTATGPRFEYTFPIDTTRSSKRARVRLEASDLSQVERAGDNEWLDFTPHAQITCTPLPNGKLRLRVLSEGFCGNLTYRWYNGATTPFIDVPFMSGNYQVLQVTLTDEAGQEVVLRGSLCQDQRFTRFLTHLMSNWERVFDFLDRGGFDPRGPKPPDIVVRWEKQIKSWVMSAGSTTPAILSQRARFLDRLIAEMEATSGRDRRQQIKTILETKMQEIESGEYVEVYESHAELARGDWNEEHFQQAKRLAGGK